MKENPDPAAPLTVSQLTQAIKWNLEGMFPAVFLQGEVSNFKLQTSGHLYFSLKDANAQISAVVFRADAAQFKALPKAGDQVIVKGELNVFPPKGNYQLIVRELSLAGMGELLLKLEQLKIKLHQQGWFKKARKRSLPSLPHRIGVVTSPTGAVIQDILHVLTRRFSGFHLILNPVKVQGEGAAEEIAQAIEQLNRYQLADVLIVGRGGGSLEDLWAFNEERVAEAIFNSRIPVVSAVGHETDHCIADYVADVRAPTPSAAAELVIAEKAKLLDTLKVIKRRLDQTMRHLIFQSRCRLGGITKQPLVLRPHLLIEWRMQKVDTMRSDLDGAFSRSYRTKKEKLARYAAQVKSLQPRHKLAHLRQRLTDMEKALGRAISYKIKEAQQRLLYFTQLLSSIDPKKLLNNGYSILFAEKEKTVISSVCKLERGQKARLLLSDGEALISIDQVYPRANISN